MAFNWQTFRTRSLTAIVFVLVMLAGLLWNQWSFLVLFTIIHFGCWWEYFRLLEKIYNTIFHPYLKLGMMLIGYGLMIFFAPPGYRIAGYELAGSVSLPLSAAGFVLVLFGIFQKNVITVKSYLALGLGVLYISLSWGCMLKLYGTQLTGATGPGSYPSFLLPIVIIASIWINDTMAYLMGSLIGKTPLSPISPKKTWEGTIAGVILAVAAVGIFFSLNQRYAGIQNLRPGFWFIIPLIASIVGTLGDLLESKLKRLAGVKDSGQIMPGHGGFLDRFDSLLLATPVVCFYVIFLHAA